MESEAPGTEGGGGWWRLARVFLLLGLAVTVLLLAIFGLAWCARGGG